MNSTTSNPFAQSPRYWKVQCTLPREAVEAAENAFADMALAVSAFEDESNPRQWRFELLCGEAPDMMEIQRRFLVLSVIHGVDIAALRFEPVAQQDWVARVARSFPPLTVGRFFVHGSHVIPPLAAGVIAIRVDAGAAFGSGEHATTKGCLEAMDTLSRRRDFTRALDMGCGSGILAVAAAKLWRCPVLAVDIDDVAVRVTQDNSRLNRVQDRVRAVSADGYAHMLVERGAPYDLIVSNILARPLMKFAPKLARALRGDGVAILSGLLASQEKQVLHAHVQHGLKLRQRFTEGGWHTLVLSRHSA